MKLFKHKKLEDQARKVREEEKVMLQREVGTIKAKQIADKKFMDTLADIGEEQKNEEEILRQKKERYFWQSISKFRSSR